MTTTMTTTLRSADISFGPVNAALLADAVAPPVVRPARQVKPRQMIIAGAVLLVVVGAVWYGYQWFSVGRYVESTDDAYVGGNVTDIAPKVSGLVAKVAVQDNQLVHAGDLLIKIDDRDYVAAAQKAAAAVAGDEAALANLAATRNLQLSLIAEARAQTTATAAQTTLATANQARYRRLAASNAGSVQDAQTAEAINQYVDIPTYFT